MKYYHELSMDERKKIKASELTFDAFMLEYKQPDWCSYPDALSGRMGCWSLWFDQIKSKSDCGKCEFISEGGKQ